jgi:hypothetical protein
MQFEVERHQRKDRAVKDDKMRSGRSGRVG